MEKKAITRKERDRLRLREEIIDAASELFSEQSYERTTVQQIAERAEISVGTIYNLFEGKEAIFLDLIELIIERLNREIQEANDNNPEPVARIRSFFRTYLDFCDRHLDAMIVIHQENPLKMQGVLKSFFREQFSMLERYFTSAIESGSLNLRNPRILSMVTFGYIHSYAHLTAEDKVKGDKEELIDLFERTLLQSPDGGESDNRTEDRTR